MMPFLSIALQIIIAGGLINVWIFRNKKSTDFRGGDAKSLKEEFKTYGLPEAVYYVIGFLKLGSAVALLVGLWLPVLVGYASVVVVGLMLGALGMHLKVGDPAKKSLPAFLMLIMSSLLAYLSLG